jgi:hypothetical protein
MEMTPHKLVVSKSDIRPKSGRIERVQQTASVYLRTARKRRMTTDHRVKRVDFPRYTAIATKTVLVA